MSARFPALDRGYESFYLRAADPERPRSVWLRHTVHQAPGEEAVGSIWVTLFDGDRDGPAATKRSVPGPRAADWIRIGDSTFGPSGVRGDGYDLRFSGTEPGLRHLPRAWMYGAPLPRTKLESPLPAATFDGSVTVGATTFELAGWPGMVGHNWGVEHAERWIWLHGTLFEDRSDAWLDLAIGRVRVGPLLTPWIVNGVVSLGGGRLRVSGRARVRETPTHVEVEAGPVRLTADSPQVVVWRYADPEGPEHHVANCSIAALEVTAGGERLRTAHGGAYELGMRETTHGLAVQPFPDP